MKKIVTQFYRSFFYPFCLSLAIGVMLYHGSIKAQCIKIESILVDACVMPEGENEMLRLRVGDRPVHIRSIHFDWPNNPWRGFCRDILVEKLIDSLNRTLPIKGLLKLPPLEGVLPAKASVLVITSTKYKPLLEQFSKICDTTYVLFQCEGNTNGHFANSGTGTRTTVLRYSYSGVNCTDIVTYVPNELIGGNGARVDFLNTGEARYENDGCLAPVVGVAPFEITSSRALPLCRGESTLLSVPSAWRVQWFRDGRAYILGNNVIAPEPGEYVAIGITPSYCIPRVEYDTLIVQEKIVPPPAPTPYPRCGEGPAIFKHNPLGSEYKLLVYYDAAATSLALSVPDTQELIRLQVAENIQTLYFQRVEASGSCGSSIVAVSSPKLTSPSPPVVRNTAVCKDSRAILNVFVPPHNGRLIVEIEAQESLPLATFACDAPPCFLRYSTPILSESGNFIYRVVVKDVATGCNAQSVARVRVADPLEVEYRIEGENCSLATVQLQVRGGIPPYRYTLGNIFQMQPRFSGISPGEYPLVVTDSLNCFFRSTISISSACNIAAAPRLITEPSGHLAIVWGDLGFCVRAILLKLRIRGQHSWQSIILNSPATSYRLRGLLPEREYELELEPICDGTSKAPLFSTTFRTPACNAPNFLVLQNVTPTSAVASWSAMQGVEYYQFSIKKAQVVNWQQDVDYFTTTATLLDLVPANTYEARVRSICFQGSVISSYIYNSFTTLVTRLESINSDAQDFSLYPNPSRGKLSIIFPKEIEGNFSLEILNLEGRKVYEESVFLFPEEREIELNLSIPSGTYICRIVNSSGQKSFVTKLVLTD
ncbi:MAG: T9SS type A sorting domain-containing protein [Bacteroidia bacterium]|nr:T9SS type A sorting domain-containing protein [Bacteroidia bacterium]